MYTEIEKLEDLKKLIMELVRSQKKFDKLSSRRSSMSLESHTMRRIEGADADLNWHSMAHDQLIRATHAASVDCGLSMPRKDYSRVEYNPSPFHCYTHQPRVPLCRQ